MFYFDKNFGFFIGSLTDNKYHKHYALQISVSTEPNLVLSLKDETDISGQAFLIHSKVEHKLICNNRQLTILINPLSAIGHQLSMNSEPAAYLIMNNNLSNTLIDLMYNFQIGKLSFKTLCNSISEALDQYKCKQEHHAEDPRIIKAIEFMDKNFDDVLSLKQVADLCNLSSTRFQHLFKEKTNLNFRRYQLWNKLVKSLPYLTTNSITSTAYTFGFSDSSHYTRTFIETFGFTPKFLLPKN